MNLKTDRPCLPIPMSRALEMGTLEVFLQGNFFFNDTAPTQIYTGDYTLSLHDALPILRSMATSSLETVGKKCSGRMPRIPRSRSEEHTSELQSQSHISYAVFCLKK